MGWIHPLIKLVFFKGHFPVLDDHHKPGFHASWLVSNSLGPGNTYFSVALLHDNVHLKFLCVFLLYTYQSSSRLWVVSKITCSNMSVPNAPTLLVDKVPKLLKTTQGGATPVLRLVHKTYWLHYAYIFTYIYIISTALTHRKLRASCSAQTAQELSLFSATIRNSFNFVIQRCNLCCSLLLLKLNGLRVLCPCVKWPWLWHAAHCSPAAWVTCYRSTLRLGGLQRTPSRESRDVLPLIQFLGPLRHSSYKYEQKTPSIYRMY
jgi:hypothetical protein